MPADAFFNLEKTKRDKLIEASKKEFSKHLFEDASINQIIKEIDMPRGSFYLYFKNKEDLYFHILESYKQDLIDKFKVALADDKRSIINSFIYLYDDITSKRHEKLISNIFLNMKSIHMEKVIDFQKKKIIIEEFIDFNRFKLAKEEVENALKIIMTLFMHSIAMSIHHPDQKEYIREQFILQIKLIEKILERE